MQSIGRYQVVRQIAARDAAALLLAHDPASGQPVALRVLPSRFANNPRLRAQVEASAALLAAVAAQAPVVPIDAIGEEDGLLYLARPYLPGGTLAERLAAGPIASPAAIAAILERVGLALDEAARRGLAHGHLTPSNVLFDEQGRAFLADFNLAPGDPALGPGRLDGARAYTNPAGAADDRPPNGAGDIYALGLLLRQMLRGRPGRPAAPLDRSPSSDSGRDSLPPWQPILARALTPIPHERYPTAGALAADVRRVAEATETARAAALAGLAVGPSAAPPPPILPGSPSPTYPRRAAVAPARPARRRSEAWLLVSLVALFPLVFVAFALWDAFAIAQPGLSVALNMPTDRAGVDGVPRGAGPGETAPPTTGSDSLDINAVAGVSAASSTPSPSATPSLTVQEVAAGPSVPVIGTASATATVRVPTPTRRVRIIVFAASATTSAESPTETPTETPTAPATGTATVSPFVPLTPTDLASPTRTRTPRPTATRTRPPPTATRTHTPAPTAFIPPSPTRTRTPSPTVFVPATATRTRTPSPTVFVPPTDTRTRTPVPSAVVFSTATWTSTPIPTTSVPPSPTRTNPPPSPTHTSVPTPTNPPPDTPTWTPVPVPTPTDTEAPPPTSTPAPTDTDTPPDTPTDVPPPTDTDTGPLPVPTDIVTDVLTAILPQGAAETPSP